MMRFSEKPRRFGGLYLIVTFVLVIVVLDLISVAATLAQWGLDEAALISSMMVSTSPALGAGLLISAGLIVGTAGNR